MPTARPRLNLTLPPELDETINRLAELSHSSKSKLVTDWLMSAKPQLDALVAALELARNGKQATAQKTIGGMVRDALEALEHIDNTSDGWQETRATDIKAGDRVEGFDLVKQVVHSEPYPDSGPIRLYFHNGTTHDLDRGDTLLVRPA